MGGTDEGAKFWLQVLTEMQNRGVKDIFIACVDGLKGFPEAIETVYPRTQVQLCIVHLVRASLNYVSWKRARKWPQTCGRSTGRHRSGGGATAGEFEFKWDSYPMVSQIWRRNWEHITPFFAHPEEIRKAIYTTNAIESLNMSLRKIIKTRGSFPNEEAAMKLLYLALAQRREEVDDADCQLEGSVEPFQYSVAGANAGGGVNAITDPVQLPR